MIGAQKKLIVIVGPTASGKTALAIALAKLLNTEIISADSRQFYQTMDIGTAKPTSEELQMAKHHFIDHLSTSDYFSAGDFEREALQLLDQLFIKHNYVIVCGGSGLYIQALCKGMSAMPAADLAFRAELEDDFKNNGITALQARLQQLNPNKLKQIDAFNPQRLMRAIEIETQQIDLKQSSIERPFEIVQFGILTERELLYKRINERVDQMIARGLLNEAQELYPQKELNALRTVGYQELFDYFDQKCTLSFAIDKIKQHTRNYAKRQMTWFKRDPEINWIPANETAFMAQEVLKQIESPNH
jgi:tRNA dimethylallyltransferase